MKKEVLLAIILGFAIGLTITFGIYTAQKALQDRLPGNDQVAANQQTSNISQHSLNLNFAGDEFLHREENLTISGDTTPGANVVISTLNNDYPLIADDKGNFSFDLGLKDDVNQILVTSFDDSGRTATKKLLVIYTTADLDTPISTASAKTNN